MRDIFTKIVRETNRCPNIVRLLYRVYEAIPSKEKDSLTKSGIISDIMGLVVDARISTHPDVPMSLIYLDLISRWSSI